MLVEIIKLPVYTKSGNYLGKVTNIEIDGDSQIITRYKVKPFSIFNEIYYIHQSQLIEITKKKIIVEDTAVLRSTKEVIPEITEN